MTDVAGMPRHKDLVSSWRVADTRHAVTHHLISGIAILACLLVGHDRAVPSLLLALGLVLAMIPFAIRAQREVSAQELILDLGVMAFCMLALAPASSSSHSHSSSPMSSAPMTAHSQSDGTLLGIVTIATVAMWAIARGYLLFSSDRSRTGATLGAIVCSACLAWMIL